MSASKQGRGRSTSIYAEPEHRADEHLSALAKSLPRLSKRKRDLACHLLNEAEKHRLSGKQLLLTRRLLAERCKRRVSARKTTKKSQQQAIRDAEMTAYRARYDAPWPIYVRKAKGCADDGGRLEGETPAVPVRPGRS
jgi:hypothetical protein